MKYQVGIVGYGDFTRLMCEYLAPYADVIVSSRQHTEGDAGFGAQFRSVEEVLSRPIIIPSIPSQFFKAFFTVYGGVINPSAIVIDVCSVKVRPLGVLQQLLPPTCQIVGTHPLLGPASVAKNGGLQGLKIALCRVRQDEATYHGVRRFLEKLGLHVIEKTPEAHDRDMAYVQGLSHYIGRIMDGMGIPETPLSTYAYDDLLDMKKIQGQDSWGLFMSIVKENPFAEEVNVAFKDATKQLDDKIAES
ncbi:MAG TPA: prephenate dehydrogenase/arogenate dehydrogenase family protein [Candidatus Saccharibacteria bacterium]|nr:prephenate dehydrogenase/arogenate dehydrogenase family protein [Candidatus Saccharibacteria bacterium]